VVNRQQDDIDRLNKLASQQKAELTQAYQRAEHAETHATGLQKQLQKQQSRR